MVGGHMRGEFYAAISQLSLERGIPRDVLIKSVEEAVKAVYRKNYDASGDIEVKIDPNTGQATVYRVLQVVENVKDPKTQISLADAKKIDKEARIGSVVHQDVTPDTFGRIAAQMTKQVMLQKIREAEHETIYKEFGDREGELVTGVVQRVENGLVIVQLGKAEAIMPKAEQVESENYKPGQRLKVLLLKVVKTPRGPQLIVSRRDKNLLKRLFEIEVPEIYNGSVEIKAIARIPGVRSKIAVAARQPGIDPVGSCVGVRGTRVQNVVDELQGEKIDIIQWSDDPATFIARALSPAQVNEVILDKETKTATVIVPEKQLSLAIGKDGQNARLAANLTGWRIDIRSPENVEHFSSSSTSVSEEQTDRLEQDVSAETISE
ncbi:transcription termination factor NusA [Thermobaculum terrenum]|nr:transcription termination factor NusA [Thermobaculum terrenum]